MKSTEYLSLDIFTRFRDGFKYFKGGRMRFFAMISVLFWLQLSFGELPRYLEAFETGQHEKAFKLLQKEIKKKKPHSGAYMMLADLYAIGSGTKRDFKKAEELLYESEKHTNKFKDCSLSVLALKFNAFYRDLMTIRNADEDLRAFREKIRKDAEEKHGYKEGICPKHDKATNPISY